MFFKSLHAKKVFDLGLSEMVQTFKSSDIFSLLCPLLLLVNFSSSLSVRTFKRPVVYFFDQLAVRGIPAYEGTFTAFSAFIGGLSSSTGSSDGN